MVFVTDITVSRSAHLISCLIFLVAPWLTPPKKDVEVKRFKDGTAQFTCAAKGNPLEVDWKVQKKGQDEVQACISKYLCLKLIDSATF